MPAGVDVHKELEMVAQLQSVDNRLLELEQEKGDLPGIVRHLEGEIDERKAQLENIQEQLAEIRKNKRTVEGQNQLARVKQEKYKEQLYQVTTNREYDAITQEIDSLRLEIEENENSQLEMLDQEEKLNDKTKKVTERIDELNAELKERRSELDEKEEETAQEEAELRQDRNQLKVQIKKVVLAHYERIREAKGVGAAPMFANACGACQMVVPPQRQAEIRKMDDIILCESCGVILLPEDEYLQ